MKNKVVAYHVVKVERLNSFDTKKEAERFLSLVDDPPHKKDEDCQYRIEKNTYDLSPRSKQNK